MATLRELFLFKNSPIYICTGGMKQTSIRDPFDNPSEANPALEKEKNLKPTPSPNLSICILKGTVSRDLFILVFFMNQLPPSPRVYH
jgi:hypothetical protein